MKLSISKIYVFFFRSFSYYPYMECQEYYTSSDSTITEDLPSVQTNYPKILSQIPHKHNPKTTSVGPYHPS